MGETRKLVHLIEDDDALRRLLARMLASSGYDVEQYESGSAFLARLGSIEAGCVLLDIHLPESDGFEVHEALRASGVAFPVVMMTGAGNLSAPALKAGAVDMINKPFGRPEMLNAIEEGFRLMAKQTDPIVLRSADD